MECTKELTLLTTQEIYEGYNEQLEVLKKYGAKSAITDLAILTGESCSNSDFAPDDTSLKGKTGQFYTRSRTSDGMGNVCCINPNGIPENKFAYTRESAIRPVLRSPYIFSQISSNRVEGYNGTEEVAYGEYPQYAPNFEIQMKLESKYQKKKLQKTGKTYTFNKTDIQDCSQSFHPVKYKEYVYKGKKYIRIKANFNISSVSLSNRETYKKGSHVWVEVSPVIWLIDDNTESLVSKRGLLSGISFFNPVSNLITRYNGVFSITDMSEYLDKYMIKDITHVSTFTDVVKPEAEILELDVTPMQEGADLNQNQEIAELKSDMEFLAGAFVDLIDGVKEVNIESLIKASEIAKKYTEKFQIEKQDNVNEGPSTENLESRISMKR